MVWFYSSNNLCIKPFDIESLYTVLMILDKKKKEHLETEPHIGKSQHPAMSFFLEL